jgi:hypothetical protein
MSNLFFLTASKWRMRAFALGMAVALTLFLVAAAGHRHEHGEMHPCTVCTVLMAELPSVDALPPLLHGRTAHVYALAPPAPAYACTYRAPALLPPSCGPPVEPRRGLTPPSSAFID